MNLPTTQISFLLHLLINLEQVTEQDCNINGYRSRLSDLENKYNLPLKEKWIKRKNRWGNTCNFKAHYLLEKDKPKATRIFNQMVSK